MLSERTKREVERRYPGVDAVNPVDLIADARTERYSTVLDLVLSDLTWTESWSSRCLSLFFELEDAAVIAENARKHPKEPVVDVPAGGEDFMLVYEVLRDTGIPVYNLHEKAAKALKTL